MDTPQEHRPGPLSRFFALLGRARPPYAALAVALAFSVAATLVGLVIPLFLKGMVDGFSLSSLGVRQIVLIALAFAGQAVGSAASGYLLTYAGQRTVANLRDLLWRKQLRLSVPFFDGHASGELVSRMNNDTAVLKTLVAENVSGFITGIISVIGAVAILLAMDWRMTAVMLGALPVTALVMVPLGRVMRRVSKGTMDQTARFTEVLSRVLSEIRLVKSSNAEDREYRRGRGAIDALLALGLREGRVQSVISPIMSFVMMGLLVAIIGYGGVRIASGAMSAGELVAFILYLIQIVMPITMITTFFTQLQKARGATESITALLDEPEETERGIGISAQDLPHVFDRFFKADRSRTQANGAGGSGLGLSIVQRIVALHSGTVTAESAGLDRGSCFTVRLPLSPPGESEGPAAGPTARSAASAAPQG